MSYENLGRGLDRIRVIIDRIFIDLADGNANIANSELILAQLNFISKISRDMSESLAENIADAYQYSD